MVTNTGSEPDIISSELVYDLGIELDSLIQVSAQVFAATQTAKVIIAGGILMKVSDPAGSDIKSSINPLARLFYVATNVKGTFLSLATLQVLGVMDQSFPKHGAASIVRLSGDPGISSLAHARPPSLRLARKVPPSSGLACRPSPTHTRRTRPVSVLRGPAQTLAATNNASGTPPP